MFHSFGYPDETGKDELTARYNKATLKTVRYFIHTPMSVLIQRY